MMEGLGRKGVPFALYSDQHSIFHRPRASQPSSRNWPVSRGAFHLRTGHRRSGITHIEALSPRPKDGSNGSGKHAGSSAVELRLRNVCTMEEANSGPAGVDRKAQPPVRCRTTKCRTGLPSAARNTPGAHLRPAAIPAHQRRADVLLEREMLHAKARPRCSALGSEERRRSACRHGWTSVAVGSRAGLALCGDTGHTDPGANNGQKRSGACVPPQARCKPSLEKTILQQAVTA